MDKLTPLLMNFIEQSARPPVQAKVSEQLNSTTTDLKSSLPTTVMNYLTGSSEDGSGNAVLSQLVNSLGPSFANALSSVTGTTIDTASDGMDTLLTNGILNIAKGVLTKSAGQEGEQGGGFNFDFLTQGKEGMVNTTLAASAPVIKQVSDNMGAKISNHFPQEIGQALQRLVDQNGGSGGAMGMAAGLMSQFLGGGGGGERAQGGEGGGGSIQQMLQNFLGPKILELIQPYLQKFEAQMTTSLENELRTKVFSPDFIKSTVMDMLSGESGGEGGGGGAIGAIGGLMNAFMKNSGNGQGGGGGGGQAEALNALGNFASSFLKK
ncbi:hypothetical protein BG006_007598 [Podila minutissima]|uniref:DUF937 domain-containing protein n=1 Tax=Podila minutissima TaxID=64525 RepID=A0A9P5SH01_9FUNG|nr:hypothetical protein BG006_007598 [Podila minutissima]